MTTPSDAQNSGQPRYGRRAADEPGFTPPSRRPENDEPLGENNYGASQEWGTYEQQYQSGQGRGQNPGAPNGSFTPNAPQPLPSRGLAITLTVVGAVLMLLVAPIAGLVGAGISVVSNSAGMSRSDVQNGSTVEPGNLGSFALSVTPASDETTCMLVNDRTEYELEKTTSTETDNKAAFFSGSDLSGKYTLKCDGLPNDAKLRELSVNDAFKGLGSAAIIFVVLEIIGLAVLIWGIVKLVKVNRRRREIMIQSSRGW
ncbi:hypothetical protein [Gleimia hominis]|uniref:hypothetical protein n=1 Tax=Gleimia hominis TaxID=595468 RepID=UPI0011AF6E6A|nr:hypothetical protein [Gleimia hominis]WIK64463.1 hypothetical protein CJ187_009220 [Gleimia hominis]